MTNKDATTPKSQISTNISSSSLSTPTLRRTSSNTVPLPVSSPLTLSPRTSRNASPIRKDKPSSALPASIASQPSAAAVQRALSASSVPQSQPQGLTGLESISRLPRGAKTMPALTDTTPFWGISPHLQSPPPAGRPPRRPPPPSVPKRLDTPSILLNPPLLVNAAPPQIIKQLSSDNIRPDPPQLQPPPPPKTSSRGASGKSTLETVQENTSDSQESSLAITPTATDLRVMAKVSDDDYALPKRDASKFEDTKPSESGSESAGNKSDSNQRGRRDSTSKSTSGVQIGRPRNPSKSTYTLSTTKSRSGDGKRNMTVETETVQSIPQSGLAPASESANRLRPESGTLKLKLSTETVRPKKERKKTERKTRSLNQGPATSKADLFEARVANYVEETNTSDSDETFVYESNPPEPQRRPRHHSRTPSVTSSHSIADGPQRGGIRGYGDGYDDRRVDGKRSMKFSSNQYPDIDSPDSKDGTVRSHTPRHIGRFGRGGHHSASFDYQDLPGTQASKLRQNNLHQSRPNSPNSPQSMRLRPGGVGGLFSTSRKHELPYDFDTEQNADDERTPLIGTVRGPRAFRHARRIASTVASLSDNYPKQSRRWERFRGRTGSYIATGFIILLFAFVAIAFVLGSNRSLINVEIRKIKNVLASEEELMLDLVVGAVNPNALSVTIIDLDLNIFATSRHGETANPPSSKKMLGRRVRNTGDPNPSQDPSGHWHVPQTRPDVEPDAQTMLLGRIFHFDQGLMFEPSPFKKQLCSSSGQVRLMKPGNDTETGGSARWEKIIHYPFELVVRGVLKYQLPISSRQQRAAVGASVMVHPEEGIDDSGNMRVEPVDRSERWQWIDLPLTMDYDDDDDDDDV